MEGSIDLVVSDDLILAALNSPRQQVFQAGECLVIPATPLSTFPAGAPASVAYDLSKKGVFALVLGCESRPQAYLADGVVFDVRQLEGDARRLSTRPDFFQLKKSLDGEYTQYVFLKNYVKP